MTDEQLIETLAARCMGWPVFASSGHRPGSRPVPHAWRWRQERLRLMVYDGQTNRPWDPLATEADARELAAKLDDPGGLGLSTADGRRAFCESAASQLPPPP